MPECQYCMHTFSTVYKLTRHQRSAKYCLALQNTSGNNFNCNHCNKSYNRQDNMLRHQKKCSKGMNKSPITESKIDDLVELISKLVDRPTANRNSVIMNLPPITDQEISEHLEHLTINFIQDGAKGYADFANYYPFKDRLICTDKSRKKICYRDIDGALIGDSGGVKLTQRFFQAIAPKNEELINTEYRTLRKQVEKIISDDSAVATNKLTDLLTKASHLQELLTKCQEAARGEENQFTKEFVNYLCKFS